MLKYEKEIKQVKNCPPSNCKTDQCTAYRFVFDGNPNNSYLPIMKMDPTRRSALEGKGQLCSAYGLSMYNDHEKAVHAYKKLKKIVKNIKVSIGDSLASGVLNNGSGLMTPPGKNGHFDFYPDKSTKLEATFKVKNKL